MKHHQSKQINSPASLDCHCRGFTLIELLVVISIISLLISILLPALGAARKQANITKCLAQIRQLGIASFAYESDNGTLPFNAKDQGGNPWPSTTTWATVLTQQYLGFKAPTGTDAHLAAWGLMCPIVHTYSQATNSSVYIANQAATSYRYNGRIGGWTGQNVAYVYQPISSDTIHHPSKVILFTDSNSKATTYKANNIKINDFGSTGWAHLDKLSNSTFSTPWGPGTKSSGTNNAVMIDGSARQYTVVVDRYPISGTQWGDPNLSIAPSEGVGW
jgi:prepilin-type N-terminal cleavage/methylation domain-containing protein